MATVTLADVRRVIAAAPQGYKDFDRGAAKKFVIDPHREMLA